MSPSPSASPDPCASAIPELANDLPTAFAYDLESPSILRFLSALAAVPEKQQQGVFDTVVAAASTPPEQAVEDAVSAVCPSLDAIYGASRAAYLVVNHWTLRDLSDAKRFERFDSVVRTAVFALSMGDRLPAQQRTLAVLPFSGIFSLVVPSPSPIAAGTCTVPDTPATARHIVQPTYSPLAISAGTSGLVRVKVALSETGDVRSARAFGETLHQSVGADDLIRASIFAAAASTYSPQVVNCVPVRGAYVFQAEYRRK